MRRVYGTPCDCEFVACAQRVGPSGSRPGRRDGEPAAALGRANGLASFARAFAAAARARLERKRSGRGARAGASPFPPRWAPATATL